MLKLFCLTVYNILILILIYADIDILTTTIIIIIVSHVIRQKTRGLP